MADEPYYDDSDQLQFFFKLELTSYYDSDSDSADPEYDDDETVIDDLEQQKAVLPDLLNAFQTTFMGKTYPLCKDQFPKGTKMGNHFISFDNEFGIVLCVSFYLDARMLTDTDATKKTLTQLMREFDGQFEDGWGENGFGFSCNGKCVYASFKTANLVKVVAPVQGHCSHFNVRWPSIDAIEHINWMLYMDNGAFDMLYRKEEHDEQVNKRKEAGCFQYYLERDQYIREHLDQFYSTR